MVNLNRLTQELQLLITEHSQLRRIVTECRCTLESKTTSAPLAGQLQLLLEKLLEHFSREKNCGYFVEAAKTVPQFQRKVNHLFRQHYLMILKVVELQRFIEPGKPPKAWARMGDIFSEFNTAFDEHEAEESELLDRVFNEHLSARA